MDVVPARSAYYPSWNITMYFSIALDFATGNTLPNFCVRDYFHYVSIVRAHSCRTFYQKCTLYPFVNHRMSKSYFCNSLHLYTWDHHDVKQPQNIRLVSPGFNTLDKVPVKTFSLWLWMIVKFVIVCLHCNSSWIPEWWYFLSPPRVCRVRNGTRLSSIYLRT